MTIPAARDRVHVDVAGLALTDSDLALLAKAVGRVVTWPSLRDTPPPEAVHMATIRTGFFRARPGGDMIAAMREYDARRRTPEGSAPFGTRFIAACQVGRATDNQQQRRVELPVTSEPQVGVDVLRMWLDG